MENRTVGALGVPHPEERAFRAAVTAQTVVTAGPHPVANARRAGDHERAGARATENGKKKVHLRARGHQEHS